MKKTAVLLTFLVLPLLLAGCPSPSAVKIPDTTKVLDAATRDCLVAVSEVYDLTFSESTGMLDGLAVGDVVVCGVGQAAPAGLLRKVAGFTPTKTGVIVQTSSAALDEAVEEGTLDAHKTLTTADLQEEKYWFSGISLERGMSAKSGDDFLVTLDNVAVYESGDDKITVSGDVTFSPSFDLTVDFEALAVKEIAFEYETDVEANIELDAEFSHQLPETWEESIATFVFSPIEFYIGTVPVVLVPQLDLSLQVDGDVIAGLSANVSDEGSLTLTASYQGGTWTTASDMSGEAFDYSPLTAPDGGAAASVEAGPGFSLLFYGLAGSYGNVQAFMGVETAMEKADVQWTLTGGFDGCLGFDAAPLSQGIADCSLATPLNYRTTIASGPTAYTDVTVEEGYQLWQSGVFVLDVRTTSEYEAGHLPGAYNINVSELQGRLDEIDEHKNDTILVNCKSGGRSATASQLLAGAGFTKIKNMLGGFLAWEDEGYPVEYGS